MRVTLEVRVLSLTVDQLYDRPHHHPRLDRTVLAELLRGCAELYRHRRAGADVAEQSLALRARIALAVGEVTGARTDAYAVLDSVSLLGRVDQLRADIAGRHPADAPDPAHSVDPDPEDLDPDALDLDETPDDAR